MLPPEALARLHRFAAAVDATADVTADATAGGGAGPLRGLYAVGSLALGDWHPHRSNLDVLAVADAAWSPAVIRSLRGAVDHLEVHGRAARVAYLTWTDLAAVPAEVTAPVVVGRRAAPPDRLINPLTWDIVRSTGVCTRGPEYPDVGICDLRGWARDQITTAWPTQVTRWRRRPASLLWRRRTTVLALEIARLSVAADSARAVSKLEAGEALIDGAPSRFQRVLKDAVGYRRGVRTSMYWGPFERKNDTVDWISSVVDAMSA